MDEQELNHQAIEFLARLKPGESKLRVFFARGNINNALWHVRAIVDENYVAVRRWSAKERGWVYGMEYWYYWWLLERDGHMSVCL